MEMINLNNISELIFSSKSSNFEIMNSKKCGKYIAMKRLYESFGLDKYQVDKFIARELKTLSNRGEDKETYAFSSSCSVSELLDKFFKVYYQEEYKTNLDYFTFSELVYYHSLFKKLAKIYGSDIYRKRKILATLSKKVTNLPKLNIRDEEKDTLKELYNRKIVELSKMINEEDEMYFYFNFLKLECLDQCSFFLNRIFYSLISEFIVNAESLVTPINDFQKNELDYYKKSQCDFYEYHHRLMKLKNSYKLKENEEK